MMFIRSDQSMVMLLMVEISSYDAMSDKQQLSFCMRRHCYSVWWRILISFLNFQYDAVVNVNGARLKIR